MNLGISPNSGHAFQAYALVQMVGYSSYFACPQPLDEIAQVRKEQ